MKYIYVFLSLVLLLSLCACVDARAEEASLSPASVEEAEELLLPEKTPADSVEGKEFFATEETSPGQKDIGDVDGSRPQIELHPIAPDPAEGEIPQPEPVEPPTEVQSESTAAQEE